MKLLPKHEGNGTSPHLELSIGHLWAHKVIQRFLVIFFGLWSQRSPETKNNSPEGGAWTTSEPHFKRFPPDNVTVFFFLRGFGWIYLAFKLPFKANYFATPLTPSKLDWNHWNLKIPKIWMYLNASIQFVFNWAICSAIVNCKSFLKLYSFQWCSLFGNTWQYKMSGVPKSMFALNIITMSYDVQYAWGGVLDTMWTLTNCSRANILTSTLT